MFLTFNRAPRLDLRVAWWTIPLIAISILASSGPAAAATLGKCRFDLEARSFAGSPGEQASCLLRRVGTLGNVERHTVPLPPRLARTVGQELGVSKTQLRQVFRELGLSEAQVGGNLDAPLSRGGANSPREPAARYFVIHDTSSPNFGTRPFPADIDESAKVNDFSSYSSVSNAKAHVFINRRGETYVGHDFSVPWRATKLEGRIGARSKGLFLHIENVQPRRSHPLQADGNAPTPGLTAAQYDRLALLYVAAGVRAGSGLVPAFHATMDEGLSDGHDDPQNFSLSDFDAALDRMLDRVR